MALSVQVLAMTWGRLARSRGLPAHQLEREYFTLLKETGAFPMRPWGEAVKCWASNLGRWDAASLTHATSELRRADMSAKDTRLSSDEQLLSNLICSLCAPSAKAAA
jgi:DNA polymerase-3 subunit delta